MTQIKTRQNEDLALNLQCVARHYFNKAEIFNFVAWCLCLLSFFSILIPKTAPNIIALGVPFVVDILVFVMVCFFNKSVSLAAQCRAVFDDYVLGFTDRLSMNQSLKECLLKVIEKHSVWITTQKKNTGKDNPPGVKEWYNTNPAKTDIDAIFMCQKENIWWDKKLVPWRIAFDTILALLCVAAFWVMISIGYISAWQVILSSALFLRICERIYEKVKCLRIGNKIDGKIETLEVSKTKEQLLELQSTINEKRGLKIVGINFIHKAFAYKFSNIYDKSRV